MSCTCEKKCSLIQLNFPYIQEHSKDECEISLFRNKGDLYLLHCKGIPLFIVQIFL